MPDTIMGTIMTDHDFIKRFHSIYEMLKISINDKEVREFLKHNNSYLWEAIEFYEIEVGTDCRFYKAGIKQMAVDIARWESPLFIQAMSLLRGTCETLITSPVVQEMHGNNLPRAEE